jgi:hypothetical protein
MSQTCARSHKSKNKLLLAALVLVIASSPAFSNTKVKNKPTSLPGFIHDAPVPGAVSVSSYEFNTFIFRSPVKRVFFPSGTPVVGNPVYVAENTQVLVQFEKSDRPIQMVAELADGSVATVRMMVRDIPGVVHAVDGAKPRKNVAPSEKTLPEAASQASAQSADIELLKSIVVSGDVPEDYQEMELPPPTRFDKFSVVPLKAWSNGVKNIYAFSLVAAPGQTAVVNAPQFYRPGITAVLLDGNVVDEASSPQLMVVEELGHE